MTPLLAHAGHWFISLLYVAPVVIVVGWLSFTQWRDNRRGGGTGEGGDAD
jgi:ABC-type polysaccharide/polyol phosphate export permease